MKIIEKLKQEIINFSEKVSVEYIEIFMSTYVHDKLCEEVTELTGVKIKKLEKYITIPIYVNFFLEPFTSALVDLRKYKLNPFYEKQDSEIWYQEFYNMPSIIKPKKI